MKNKHWKIEKTKSFSNRLLIDFFGISIWFLPIVIYYGITNGVLNSLLLLLLFSPIWFLIAYKSYNANIKLVKEITLDQDTIKIICINSLNNEEESLIFDRKKLQISFFREYISYPVATHLKFILEGKELFRHYRTLGWTDQELLDIKKSHEN